MPFLRTAPFALLLSACGFLFNDLPPLPSTPCDTYAEITGITATDAGVTQVTFGCNQAPASACDGGQSPACPTSVCVEVDWVGVSASYNGNCSNASPVGLTAASACTPLIGDAGFTQVFVTTAAVPTPMLVNARLVDGGGATTCDSTCAGAAVTCACNAALAGTQGQSCVNLK